MRYNYINGKSDRKITPNDCDENKGTARMRRRLAKRTRRRRLLGNSPINFIVSGGVTNKRLYFAESLLVMTSCFMVSSPRKSVISYFRLVIEMSLNY